jgi:hypothetical protein
MRCVNEDGFLWKKIFLFQFERLRIIWWRVFGFYCLFMFAKFTLRRLEFNVVHAGILVLCLVFIIVFVRVHLSVFPSWEGLKLKPRDSMAPMYSVVAVITSLVGALGFGRPYSPATVTICGFFLNGIVVGPLAPGLWDWMDKFIGLVVPIVLLVQYFYRCRTDIVRVLIDTL